MFRDEPPKPEKKQEIKGLTKDDKAWLKTLNNLKKLDNAPDLQHGKEVMSRAAHDNNWKAVTLLAQKGVKITPILFNAAIAQGRYYAVDVLIKNGAVVNAAALDCAAGNSQWEVMPLLLVKIKEIEPGSWFAKNTGKILLKLAYANEWDIVQSLIQEKNVDVNEKYIIDSGFFMPTPDTLISHAAKTHQWEQVRWLLDKGAKGFKFDELLAAARDGQWDLVNHVIKNNIKELQTEDYNQLLYIAASSDTTSDNIELLMQKANADAKVKGIALLRAASSLRWNNVKFLMDKGADINIVSSDGKTALHYAASNKQWKLVKSLVEKGADININAKDNYAETALHYAAQSPQWDIVKFLIEHGADINSKNFYGTALHYAAEAQNIELVNWLAGKGADLNSKNLYERTIWDLVKDKNAMQDLKIIAELKNACENHKQYYLKKDSKKYAAKIKDLDGLLQQFIGTDDDNKTKIDNFNIAFEASQFNQPKDAIGKKFKRIILGIISLGVYAIVRGHKIGSPKFWQYKREVFAKNIETINRIKPSKK